MIAGVDIGVFIDTEVNANEVPAPYHISFPEPVQNVRWFGEWHCMTLGNNHVNLPRGR